MYCANIKYFSASDGIGVRTAFLCSGCRLHCKGCHNPETHDFKYGKECTEELIDEMIEKSNSEHITGLSIYGGEPLDIDNQEGIFHIIERWKEAYPNKNIWLWTGYDFSQFKKIETPFLPKILRKLDTIIVGPFIESQKNLNKAFRGSENQKIFRSVLSKDGKKLSFRDVTSEYDN